MHAILIHGWKGWPENGWFPWLQRELEAQGWTTESLAMPNPTLPRYEPWVTTVLGHRLGPDTVIIAHSLACLTVLWALMRYQGEPLAKIVFVSGFCRPFLPAFIRPVRTEWFPQELKIDRRKARQWVVIHAKLDPLVPFAEGEHLAEILNVPLVIPQRIGHLTHQEGAMEVPEILDAVLK